ncbi:MAG: molybdopterin molybdotransferase MoeA [Alphaproteobacteria bacterium GM7ARS4]|nr:molybdopterin molybdotransferase MoeA [Alphaproteobacteria bacterium GM7ARS4]
MKEWLSVDDAQRHIEHKTTAIARTCAIPLHQAYGRLLAHDVITPRDVPPYDNAAVDGYGIMWDDELLQEERPAFRLVGRATAGAPARYNVKKRQAVQLFTGTCMTDIEGVDTILMEEACQQQDAQTILFIDKRHAHRGMNYRLRGEDVRQGQNILPRGWRLRPQDMAMLAAMGHPTVDVMDRVRVGLFSSGNEIYDVDTPSLPQAGTYDSNRYAVRGMLSAWGAAIDDGGILPDHQETMSHALRQASYRCDILITSGSISASESDAIGDIISRYGALDFWRVKMKPGRPIAFGRLHGTPILALPGNPVAVTVTFLLFARLLLQKRGGGIVSMPPRYPVTAFFSMDKKPGRREWIRCRLVERDGVVGVERFMKTGAGLVTSLVRSDGLIDIAEDITHIHEGDSVFFTPYTAFLS